jgi:CBS domain-containing protein
MQVKDIMTSEVISVDEDVSIIDVAEIMTNKKIHGVPVVDKDMKVVGIITETDFIDKEKANILYLPSFVDFLKSGKAESPQERNDVIRSIITAKVKDVMTSTCFTVKDDMKIEDFINFVKEKGYVSFPVIDSEGKLAGIITETDIIKLL